VAIRILSIRQIQQHTVRIRETLLAELAAFQIFLAGFTVVMSIIALWLFKRE